MRLQTGKRPRIMHLFNAFEVGGVERQHMMLVKHLAPYFDQACWSYNHGPIEDELDALGIPHRVGRFPVAAQMLNTRRYDAVVLRTNRYLCEMAEYFLKSDIPVVYIRSFLRWFEGNKTYFDAELEFLSYSFPVHCFFSGPTLLNNARRLNMDIPGAELLTNGLVMDRFPMRPRQAPRSEVLTVGMLANLSPHKNQLAAIEVLREGMLAGRYRLVLGGAAHFPDYAARVQAAAEGLPVEMKGYVSNPVEFFSGVDALLLTSTHEGWPIVVMEAMACGIPVAAPNIGDIPVLLNGGSAGLLYADGQYERVPGILESLRDPQTYARFAKASVARAGEFDIRRSAARLRQVIEDALAGPLPEVAYG